MDGFSKFHFNDLSPDEKIVRIIHRNWFYLFQQFFWLFVVTVVIYESTNFIPTFFPDFLAGDKKAATLFVQNFFMLAIWIYGFMIWIDYYYDIWIITTERIVNIEQKGMFTRKASEMRFHKVQDVTTEVVGFFPTILNYGDVKIQTAAQENEFLFRTISDPYDVKKVIMDLQKQSENNSKKDFEEMIEGIKK